MDPIAGVLTALFVVFAIFHVICWILIIVDAFQNELWMGLLSLLCGFYAAYYAIFEFDHERKWLIVGGYLAPALVNLGIAAFIPALA